jgi:hydrogenase nickel incorporation protein HypB
MCETCGCGQPGEFTIRIPHTRASHHPVADQSKADYNPDYRNFIPDMVHSPQKVIDIQKDILSENNSLAGENRAFFESRNITCLNLVSSPGSGKTSLLEKTIIELKDELPIYAIEGDQQTSIDAERIQSAGAPVVQINTISGCHLDARMIHNTLETFEISNNSILFIENVGNLVCPALFDLGEYKRVLIMSVTEGEDKPLKYPAMFQSAHLCIINKTDILPYVDFDMDQAIRNARQVNQDLEFIQLSVKKGEGMNHWYEWCRNLKNLE